MRLNNAGFAIVFVSLGVSAAGDSRIIQAVKSQDRESVSQQLKQHVDVKALLAHGANVNANEKLRGQTALMWAVAQRHPAVVRRLLEHGADVHARSRITSQLVVRDVEGARFVCPPDVSEEDRRKSSYKI